MITNIDAAEASKQKSIDVLWWQMKVPLGEFLAITGKCLNRKSGDASSNRIFQINNNNRNNSIINNKNEDMNKNCNPGW